MDIRHAINMASEINGKTVRAINPKYLLELVSLGLVRVVAGDRYRRIVLTKIAEVARSCDLDFDAPAGVLSDWFRDRGHDKFADFIMVHSESVLASAH